MYTVRGYALNIVACTTHKEKRRSMILAWNQLIVLLNLALYQVFSVDSPLRTKLQIPNLFFDRFICGLQSVRNKDMYLLK